MTSRSPEWISVGNLGGGRFSGCAASKRGLGALQTALPRKLTEQMPLSSTSLLRHWGSTKAGALTHFPSFNREGKPLLPHGIWLPSLQQPFLVAGTHKALMFSVTAEVYCGSVCGKTKYT